MTIWLLDYLSIDNRCRENAFSFGSYKTKTAPQKPTHTPSLDEDVDEDEEAKPSGKNQQAPGGVQKTYSGTASFSNQNHKDISIFNTNPARPKPADKDEKNKPGKIIKDENKSIIGTYRNLYKGKEFETMKQEEQEKILTEISKAAKEDDKDLYGDSEDFAVGKHLLSHGAIDPEKHKRETLKVMQKAQTSDKHKETLEAMVEAGVKPETNGSDANIFYVPN